MNFISYAPNFEDILLWRALRHVDAGCYLDVGAADPLHGSVTQAFYQRGWRGVNLEPAPALHARLCQARPADLNLALGAAASAGPARFYDAQDSQRSGFLPAQAQACLADGLPVVQREVPCTTLAELCRQHVDGTIHFLNVAVNGDEAAVLAGMDWQQWRPWIVLVRTGAGADLAALGERMRAAHYALAYRDGHKDYYVAAEQAALATALALPPHGEDQFTLYEGHHYAHPLDQWRARTAAAEQAASEANAWVAAHERGWTERATQAETRLEQALRDRQHGETTLQQQLQAAHARASQAEAAAAQAQAVAAQALANGHRCEAELVAIYGSVAWKLARPIRGAVRLARHARDLLRRGAGRLRRALARWRGQAVGALRAGLAATAKRAVRFVLARPALASFLRQRVERHPRLSGMLRTAVLRARARPQPAAQAATPADHSHLPAATLQVYDELQRALRHARDASGAQ